MNIVDRQTFVISVNLNTLNESLVVPLASQVNLPMNLRFAADELIVKSIAYHTKPGTADVEDTVQIWCNITNDGLIGAFPNTSALSYQHNEHFRISNSFQNGNFVLQFQGTDGSIDNVPNFGSVASYNPQRLISAQNPQRTFGVVVITIEFVKLAK